MFKKLIPFRIMADADFNKGQLENALSQRRFVPCTPTQKTSIGWATPVEHGDFVHSISGHWLLNVQIEKKMLPASVIKERVEKRAQELEQLTGKKMKAKDKKALKEEIELELLPKAFSKMSRINVWIDRNGKWFGVEGTASAADTVTTLLAATLDAPTGLRMIYPADSPSGSMTAWLLDEAVPAGLDLDQHCSLSDTSMEGKPTVTYDNHLLDREDVKAHLKEGKLPVALGLQMGDKAAFVMTSTLTLKKISFLDAEAKTEAADSYGNFDADFLIAASTMSIMLESIIEAMGGEDPALVAAAEDRLKAQTPEVSAGFSKPEAKSQQETEAESETSDRACEDETLNDAQMEEDAAAIT